MLLFMFVFIFVDLFNRLLELLPYRRLYILFLWFAVTVSSCLVLQAKNCDICLLFWGKNK